MTAVTRPGSDRFATNRSGCLGEWSPTAALSYSDDFGHDADCHLFWRIGPDVESNRTANATDRLIADTGRAQAIFALTIRLSAADGADIARPCFQRSDQSRLIELGIMGQDGDIGVSIDCVGRQRLIGPGDEYLVRFGEPVLRREHRAGIVDQHAEPEHLRQPSEGLGDMYSSENDERGRGGIDIVEEIDLPGGRGRR